MFLSHKRIRFWKVKKFLFQFLKMDIFRMKTIKMIRMYEIQGIVIIIEIATTNLNHNFFLKLKAFLNLNQVDQKIN